MLPFSLKQDLVYSDQSLAEEKLLDPRPRREWTYKIVSLPPFVRVSVSFLGIGSLFFSDTQHNVSGPYHIQLFVTELDFLENIQIRQKRPKMAQKHGFLDFFKKTTSLVWSGICVKSKSLGFTNILWKLYAWEKSSSQVKNKNVSRLMTFHYSLIISISLIDLYLTLFFGIQIDMNKRNKAD